MAPRPHPHRRSQVYSGSATTSRVATTGPGLATGNIAGITLLNFGPRRDGRTHLVQVRPPFPPFRRFVGHTWTKCVRPFFRPDKRTHLDQVCPHIPPMPMVWIVILSRALARARPRPPGTLFVISGVSN